MASTGEWQAPFARLGRFSVLFVTETIGTLIVISVIAGVHWYVTFLGKPTLFGRIPVEYITDATELGVLSIYGVAVVLTVGLAVVRELLRHR
jgi:hypothetical protein